MRKGGYSPAQWVLGEDVRLPSDLNILGVILFGAGVITFFAASWAEMPKLVKLVVLFGGLWAAYGAAGWLLTRDERGESQFGEALLPIPPVEVRPWDRALQETANQARSASRR